MSHNLKNPTHVLTYLAVIFMLQFLPACARSAPGKRASQARLPPQNLVGHQGVTKKPAYLSALKTTQESIIYSRSSPAALGTPVFIDHMSLKVTGLVRPADALVAKGNMFNATPAAGQEYIFVNLSATCKLSPGQPCTISDSDFKMIGSSGSQIVSPVETFFSPTAAAISPA